MISSSSWMLVLLSFLLMVASNVLSQQKAFGPDNKTLSDESPTFVTPDGFTFAVWGLIYLLITALTVVQIFPSERGEELLQPHTGGLDVRQRLACAFLANAAWLPCFAARRNKLALLVMVLYLALLISLHLDLNVDTVQGPWEQLFYAAPISANLSWIVVATCVNAFVVLREEGWKDEHGVGGSANAAKVVVLFVAALGALKGYSCDFAWAFVAAWALMGINRMQTIMDKVRFPLLSMSPSLAFWSQCGAVVISVSVAVGAASAALKLKQ